MSWDVSPWVYPVWDSLCFLDLGGYCPPRFRQVFNCYLLKYFLMPFLVVFFWDSYDSNVGAFNIVPGSLRLSSFLFFSFFYFPLCFIYFHHSIFHLTYPLFCLSYSTFVSLSVHFSSVQSCPTLCDPIESFKSQLLHCSLLIDSSLFLLGPC